MGKCNDDNVNVLNIKDTFELTRFSQFLCAYLIFDIWLKVGD